MNADLLRKERVIADRGHPDNRCDYLTDDLHYAAALYTNRRARHENAIHRIKKVNLVGHSFCPDKSLHAVCFHAVFNLVKLIRKKWLSDFTIQL